MTTTTRSLILQHWSLSNARRWDEFARLLDPALRYEVPQTREYSETGEGYLDMFRTWPGDWQARVTRLVCDGDQAVCVIDFVVDGSTMTGISMFELRDGRIVKVTDYWPEDYEPPARLTPHLKRRPAKAAFDIRLDDLNGPEIQALLEEHLRHMHSMSPPESVHALDLSGLKVPEVSFWTVWEGEQLMGCGALKALGPDHGEIKSMRTAQAHRQRGVGRAVLSHILDEARARGYRQISLETGPMDGFAPARALYRSMGFVPCPPFADYTDDPNSVFMRLVL
ncbi:GNAT family N-acetyltransferase [Ideonella sp.]|uniref:GNAT family N-acetyltransferase n=1 Tax=Ideonella sp. TaxID=1929293 RepID=UPI003BB72D65